MMKIDDIKAKLQKLLIERDGNVSPHELIDITKEAKDIGVDEVRIKGLLSEVDRSINWPHIAEKKKEEHEKSAKATAVVKQQEEQIKITALEARIEVLESALANITSFAQAMQVEFSKRLRLLERAKIPVAQSDPDKVSSEKKQKEYNPSLKNIILPSQTKKPSSSPAINYVHYRNGKK